MNGMCVCVSVSIDQRSVENTTSGFISNLANEDNGEKSEMQLNDTVNQPDAQGRVLINVNHPEDESDIYLPPQLARVIKPHQVICQANI